MANTSVCIIVILIAAIIMHWRIRSGYYKKIKLPLKERLFGAFICIIPPTTVFMSKPKLYLGIVICTIFICVLLYGSKLEKTSKHQRNQVQPPINGW
jgi:phosphatidylserine synthase